jgi:hypothetical protein
MIDIKLSLTILVPGADMIRKAESLKSTQVPVINKKTGKQVFKQGKPLVKTILVEDPLKHDLNSMFLKDKKGKIVDRITFYTRKSVPARRSLNLSREAYEYMVSEVYPEWYKQRNWKNLTKEQRLAIHLDRIAANFGGVLEDFIVYDD